MSGAVKGTDKVQQNCTICLESIEEKYSKELPCMHIFQRSLCATLDRGKQCLSKLQGSGGSR